MVGKTNPVKRIVMLICSVILVGFALADFNSAVRPFSLFHMEEGKEKAEQTISDHGKRTAQSLDADQSETEVLWQNIKRSKPGMARSMAFFLACVFTFCGFVFRISLFRSYLRFYRSHVFHLARFRCELITQKEKDGKKRAPVMEQVLL
nr:hypothetical protein [uncultured Sellimonas sp.]